MNQWRKDKRRVKSIIQDHLHLLAKGNKEAVLEYLTDHDLLRHTLQVTYDLYGTNPLSRCMIKPEELDLDNDGDEDAASDDSDNYTDEYYKFYKTAKELELDQLHTAKFIVNKMYKRETKKNE